MMAEGSNLVLLSERYAAARLAPSAPVPEWAAGEFVSITRTRDELSIVCSEQVVPAGVQAERGFRCLRVGGPLAFDLVGILESVARPLAEAGVPIFAVSTYDTDYILVPGSKLDVAVQALTAAGHSLQHVNR